jgi:hypothetical protein
VTGGVGVEAFGESTAFGRNDGGELKLIVVAGVLVVGLVELDAVLH